MKAGILSDTHDQGELIEKAVDYFNEQKVNWVIHCGDWVSPFILYFFRKLEAPLFGVFGNNDGDRFRHLAFKNKWPIQITYEERFLEMHLGTRLVAVFHGDYTPITDALVTCGKYDAVFHGHTHLRINETINQTLSLNPGSLMKVTSSEVTGASIAIYDTINNTGSHHLL